MYLKVWNEIEMEENWKSGTVMSAEMEWDKVEWNEIRMKMKECKW